MKKHEVVLDFTSLLDVILIILFLVLCTMNGKAQKDSDKIDELTQAQITMAAQIENQAGQIEELENTNKEQAERLEEMEAVKKENDRLQAERDDAVNRLDKVIEYSGMGSTNLAIFELFKGRVTPFVLELTHQKDGVECVLILYSSDKQVGETLVFDSHKNRINSNTNMICAWLSSLIASNTTRDENTQVFIVVRYKDSGFDVGLSNGAYNAVIKGIEKTKSNGYDLLYAIDMIVK